MGVADGQAAQPADGDDRGEPGREVLAHEGGGRRFRAQVADLVGQGQRGGVL